MAQRGDKDVRAWEGVVAEANRLDEVRAWVVWGVGAPPERGAQPDEDAPPITPGNDIAEGIARRVDPEWESRAPQDRWCAILEADEDIVDEWVIENEQARGYAPYLIDARQTAVESTEPMRGVLRSDAVRRRKPGRMDAGRPD